MLKHSGICDHLLVVAAILAFAGQLLAQTPPANPHKAPLYWSVYEYCYTTNGEIPEAVWETNIDWVESNLKPHGYNMVCIDGWGDDAPCTANGYRVKHARSWTHDYAWWSAELQRRGMTLGIYDNPLWIRGAATVSGAPATVVGTTIPVASLSLATNPHYVDVRKPGAEQYVKGCVQYYADMGVKFLRVDFLSWYQLGNYDRGLAASGGSRLSDSDYTTALRWIKEACDANNMLFSLVMPNLDAEGAMERQHGHMMRINSDCFGGGWLNFSSRDRGIRRPTWSQWSNAFDGYTYWSYVAGKKNIILDGDFIRLNTFSNDTERQTVISLHLLAGGPLAVADQYNTIGGSLPLYQNPEMLALNADGFVGKPLSNDPAQASSQIWAGQMSDGSWVVGLFNREDTAQTRTINFATQLGFASGAVRDLWVRSDLGSMTSYSASIPARGCTVLKIVPASPQVLAPGFTPGAGTYGAWNFSSPQVVTISTDTPGASIRYTTDGSTPTPTTGNVYSGPVTVRTSTTLKAIAYKSGMGNSPVSTAAYNISNNLQAEELSPVGTSTVIMASDALADSAYFTVMQSTSTGRTLEFTTPVIAAGTYSLQLRHATGRNYGRHSVRVDGVQVGGTVDQYASSVTFKSVTLGNVTFAGTGAHKILLTVSGKNGSSSSRYISADLFVLTPASVTASAPAIPAGLTGIALASGREIAVSWTGDGNAASYNVKRSATPGGPYTTIASGVNATSFTDMHLSGATAYHYAVSAVGAGGESANSAEAALTTTTAGALPNPPNNLRSAAGNGRVTLSWLPALNATGYTVRRSAAVGGPYTILASDLSTTTYVDEGLANGSIYYYLVNGVNPAGTSSDPAPLAAMPGADLPSPWTSRDINVAAAGGNHYANGTFTIAGSGYDIIGTSDGFRYIYENVSGDCRIQARVVDLLQTDPWAKSGVMIRESAAANAAYGAALVTPAGGVAFQWRATTGGITDQTYLPPGSTTPKWVRLGRTAGVFTAHYSDNGTDWTQIGTSQNLSAIGAEVLMGLAVTSHQDSVLTVSTIDNVSGTPVIASPLAKTATTTAGYEFALSATGGTPPYQWNIASGSLPAGLVLDSAGVIRGTPSTAGRFSCGVTATDSTGNSGSGTVIVPVVAPYGGVPMSISATQPTTIRASDYDLGGEASAYHAISAINPGLYRTDGINLEDSQDAGGGYSLGWITDGQWTGHTVSVPVSGVYDIGIRTASGASGGVFRLETGPAGQAGGAGTKEIASFAIQPTGSWYAWTTLTIPNVRLEAGLQWLRFVQQTGGYNLNYVTFTPVASQTPLEAWRSANFTQAELADPAISGNTANPAGDGISNLMKYALGLNPAVAYSPGSLGLPYHDFVMWDTNTYLGLTFNANATDVTYGVQATSDLLSWTTIYSSNPGVAPGTITVRDTVPMSSATNRFMRLSITAP